MTVFISVIIGSLVISAACSLFEATLYSTRVATLESVREDPRRRVAANRFLDMKRDIAAPTAAILILNTAANTAGASIAGMYAADILGVSWVPVFSALLTVAILLFSEILPKTYAAINWRSVWPWVVHPLSLMQRGLSPLIWLTQRFAQLFSGAKSSVGVSEDEILAMIRLGAQTGELTANELELLDAVFSFDDVLCREVQLPRREIAWLDSQVAFKDNLERIRTTRHTRYPVGAGSLDEAVQVVHIKDLVGLDLDAQLELSAYLRPLHRFPESMSVRAALREMQQSKRHMALVVDEYGTVTGLVTLELIVEQIIGPVQDEFDDEAPEIVREDPQRYTVGGQVPLARLRRELGLELEAPGVDTLSGLVVHRLGRVPVVGDKIDIGVGTASVLETSDARVTKVRLRIATQPEEEAGGDERS